MYLLTWHDVMCSLYTLSLISGVSLAFPCVWLLSPTLRTSAPEAGWLLFTLLFLPHTVALQRRGIQLGFRA